MKFVLGALILIAVIIVILFYNHLDHEKHNIPQFPQSSTAKETSATLQISKNSKIRSAAEQAKKEQCKCK